MNINEYYYHLNTVQRHSLHQLCDAEVVQPSLALLPKSSFCTLCSSAVPTWCLFFLMSLNFHHLPLFRTPYLILCCSLIQNSSKLSGKKKISAGLMLNTKTKADKVCLAPGLFFSSKQMKTAVQMQRDKSWGRPRQNEGHCVQTGSATSHRSSRLISHSDFSHRRTNLKQCQKKHETPLCLSSPDYTAFMRQRIASHFIKHPLFIYFIHFYFSFHTAHKGCREFVQSYWSPPNGSDQLPSSLDN